jgi:hypothetical protein
MAEIEWIARESWGVVTYPVLNNMKPEDEALVMDTDVPLIGMVKRMINEIASDIHGNHIRF